MNAARRNFILLAPKLYLLPGEHGKLTPEILSRCLRDTSPGDQHQSQPAVISLSQVTEAGTVYRPDEIAALTAIARQHKLYVHMDGARIANAIVSLNCSPADMTWRAGVDVLSFGATKNGALAAEAVLFFNPALVGKFCIPAQTGRASGFENAVSFGATGSLSGKWPMA